MTTVKRLAAASGGRGGGSPGGDGTAPAARSSRSPRGGVRRSPGAGSAAAARPAATAGSGAPHGRTWEIATSAFCRFGRSGAKAAAGGRGAPAAATAGRRSRNEDHHHRTIALAARGFTGPGAAARGAPGVGAQRPAGGAGWGALLRPGAGPAGAHLAASALVAAGDRVCRRRALRGAHALP